MRKYVKYFRRGVLAAVVGLYLVAAFATVLTALPDPVRAIGRIMFFIGIPLLLYPIAANINNGRRFALYFMSGLLIGLVGLGLGST